jgi:ATP-binding cassette subfamily B protein
VLLCALGSAGAALVFPMCVRYITAHVLTGAADRALRGVLAVGALMVLLILIEAALNVYYDYKGHSLGAAMENDLRQELFTHLQKLPFSYYDNRRVGEIMSSLTNDLLNLSELYHHGPEDYVINAAKFFGASFVLFAIDWRLTLLVYAFLPPMGYLTLKLNRRVRKASAENQKNIAEINARAEDALSGVRITQAFGCEAGEIKRFRALGARFAASRRGIYWNESIEDKGLMLLERAIFISVAVFGAIAIGAQSMAVADLIAFFLYIAYLTQPVRGLAWMTTQFQTGLAGFDRVMEILSTEPEIADLPGAVRVQSIRGEIEFQGVSFRYGEGRALVLLDLNMRIGAGECVAVVGISGAGKTTLCALIPRFYEPIAGRIYIDGRDIREMTLESLRANISMVQQDTYLFAESILENIRYSKPGATDAQVHAAAARADADGFIRAMPQGYHTNVGPRGVRLSGGQRQRVAIARAFLRDAPILILDEATSALDSESERSIHAAIERLREGRTTLLIAHRLQTIRLADRIIVLSEGGVAQAGTHAQLMAEEGVYAKLYNGA